MEKKQITNPVKAIRAYCLGCAETRKEVELCSVEECSLHPFRLGKNPFRTKRELTDEQKAAMAERLAKVRETRKAESAQ